MLDGRTATRGITVALAGLLALVGCGGSSSSGGGGGSGSSASTTWVHHWNEIAIDASGLDHTPVAPGETRVFGEQLGPGRASRAMAVVGAPRREPDTKVNVSHSPANARAVGDAAGQPVQGNQVSLLLWLKRRIWPKLKRWSQSLISGFQNSKLRLYPILVLLNPLRSI